MGIKKAPALSLSGCKPGFALRSGAAVARIRAGTISGHNVGNFIRIAPRCAHLTMATDKSQLSVHDELVSTRIRSRIKAAGVRFHANDNIADFIEEGELAALQAEVQARLVGVLESLVIDVDSDHNTQDTARRVAKMYVQEVFRGRYIEQPPVTEFPNIERLNELMIVGPITVRSACSHHLCPIMGKVWVGVMPNEHSNLIGLSKYARLIEWVMSRPQIQEEAVSQIADLLMQKLQPDASPS